jgi:ElaB/YqjD/DUF883 family membrane-anchored ribosome-binding protein
MADPDEPTDTERAREALDELEHLREFHTREDPAPHQWRDGTPAILETLDELLRLWGHTVKAASVEERLADLRDDDSYRSRQEREDVLGRLDAVADAAEDLAAPVGVGSVVRYPFGRSRRGSRDRIEEAVHTLRDVLGEVEEERIEGWGLRAVAEPPAATESRAARDRTGGPRR